MHSDGPFSPFDALVGLSVVELSGDRVVVEWDVHSGQLQPYGIVHGGVYSTAVETAASVGAATWFADRGTVVGISNQTDFFRAVRDGHLRAVATPIHRGRSTQLWEVLITDEQRQLVARGQVRLQNLTAG